MAITFVHTHLYIHAYSQTMLEIKRGPLSEVSGDGFHKGLEPNLREGPS